MPASRFLLTMNPLIGITVDNKANTSESGTYELAICYTRCVAGAGGTPILLPHEPQRVQEYLELCHGLLLTGGGDPTTEQFGQPTDTRARCIDPQRQQFELALLEGAAQKNVFPVLGVCLGMQLMALHANGLINQYLPDTITNPHLHDGNNAHAITFLVHDSVLKPSSGMVISSHRQAIADPGNMRTVATAEDGIIEAIDLPDKTFYLGVQWHPERDVQNQWPKLNLQLIHSFVDAARHAM